MLVLHFAKKNVLLLALAENVAEVTGILKAMCNNIPTLWLI